MLNRGTLNVGCAKDAFDNRVYKHLGLHDNIYLSVLSFFWTKAGSRLWVRCQDFKIFKNLRFQGFKSWNLVFQPSGLHDNIYLSVLSFLWTTAGLRLWVKAAARCRHQSLRAGVYPRSCRVGATFAGPPPERWHTTGTTQCPPPPNLSNQCWASGGPGRRRQNSNILEREPQPGGKGLSKKNLFLTIKFMNVSISWDFLKNNT